MEGQLERVGAAECCGALAVIITSMVVGPTMEVVARPVMGRSSVMG